MILGQPQQYKTIYADPPWAEYGGGKIKRGADRHYPLMKTKAIMDLPVNELTHSDGCHLYMWVTNNFLSDGLKVIDSWGFRYITNIVWVKDRFGLGQYFRGQHELCLFGVKKGFVLPYKIKENGKRGQCPTIFYAKRGKHSQKPHSMYNIIETVSHAPRIELFARNTKFGWDNWGNEDLNGQQTLKNIT